jgi:CTP:molybdopterin cytidylyltransferase MocA
MVRGVDVALGEIAETRAVLIWPARMAWVGPETVTSMIETHGTAGEDVLVPTFEGATGWPLLVPASELDRLRAIAADQMPPAIASALVAGGPSRELALGDPGVVHDVSTARADLPAYVGPTEPLAGHVHEWGAEAAMTPEDGPLEGPALAPFPPAGADEPLDA